MKSMELGNDLTSFPLDRISNLPDDILVHILSTLQLRESAKTSVLSRRWLNLWTLVPRLCFDARKEQPQYRPENQWIQERSVFVNWVSHVLSMHKSSYLREFTIFYQLDSCHQNEIDNWLEYAFGRGVESLELNFSRFDIFDSPIKDSYSLTNELLERIALKEVGFSRVRALCFSVVNISGEAIEFLLRKCPLLEDLRVIGSKALVNVVVSGPSLLLKHLQITDCYCYEFESITISETNIVSLSVTTTGKGHLFLDNLPMLTDVSVFEKFTNRSVLLSQLSCCLSQLTVLTLQTRYFEKEISKFPELHNLRRLVLSIANCGAESFIGLAFLIDSCPRLVEFTLILHPIHAYRFRLEPEKAMEQPLKGLKVFELHGYRGRLYTNESALIMFFIENAVALEKIIIDPREVTINNGCEPVETEQAKEYRRHAIETFKGLVVPKHVQLVIL